MAAPLMCYIWWFCHQISKSILDNYVSGAFVYVCVCVRVCVGVCVRVHSRLLNMVQILLPGHYIQVFYYDDDESPYQHRRDPFKPLNIRGDRSYHHHY